MEHSQFLNCEINAIIKQTNDLQDLNVTPCFHREDFDQEEKARFGELCSGEAGKGREWFAKYVSAQVKMWK